MSAHQYDEGHTVAGWTGCAVAVVGSAVLGLGVIMVSAPVLADGLAIVVVSVLVTWALHLTGWGKPPGRRPREEWGMRVRDSSAREGHPGCVGCRLAGRGRVRSTAVEPVPEPEVGSVVVTGEPAPAGAEAAPR
ncbi:MULTISPECIES: HGxxPAAW family protein [unclassified Streptomyces]|uniref:HGxxPAAW family protein n=1 Tax=unclassified Streptomyces TaxID=2593676 RepID=UPI0036E531DA